MTVVLDACAVIAYERDELGADVVESYLLGDEKCLIHVINLCEVYYDFLRVSGLATAEQVVLDLLNLEVIIWRNMDDNIWKGAANYKSIIRKISLADCFALSLSHHFKGSLLTSDRKEFEPVVNLNITQIKFIR